MNSKKYLYGGSGRILAYFVRETRSNMVHPGSRRSFCALTVMPNSILIIPLFPVQVIIFRSMVPRELPTGKSLRLQLHMTQRLYSLDS